MLNTELTMGEALRQVIETHGEGEALICGDVRLTYGQLLKDIQRLASGLHKLGLDKGDKVACLLPPGEEFARLFFALAQLGGVIVPLNPQLRPHTLKSILTEAEPVALVHAARKDPGIGREIPSLSHVIVAGEAEGLTLDQLLTDPGSSAQARSEVTPTDLLALLYTSGTTGTPKGTMHTHASLIAPVVASTRLRELWLRRPGLKTLGQTAKALTRYRSRLLRAVGRPQTFLSTVPWHTITGLEVMLQGLLMGDRLVVMPRFHPHQTLELVERERVTILIAVPMAFQIMLGMPDFDRFDTSSLLICATGSAPCPPELAREMQRRVGCAVHIGYGATETAGGISATSIADSADLQAATVGPAMPGMEIKIVDELRRPLPSGQVGELAVRSVSLMMG
jgi:acyl-CoA synthetase (AMP-forming)/AMP-acid ligase II